MVQILDTVFAAHPPESETQPLLLQERPEQIYKTVLEHCLDGILMLDLQTGRPSCISPALLEITGFSREEILRTPITALADRLHPDDRSAVCDWIQRMTAGRLEVMESTCRWRKTDGEYRWLHGGCRLVRTSAGQPAAIVCSLRDITAQKAAEERTSFQAHLLESVNDAICAMDGNYVLTYWNAMAEDLFGWSPAEAIGRPASELLRTVVKDPGAGDALMNMIAAGHYRGEASYRHKDGRLIHTRVHSRVIRDAQSNVREIVASFRDITERLQAESALRESEARALALVERLQQADRDKNRFISIISHELRNPLAAIVISLSLLDHEQADASQSQRAREVIRRQSAQLSRLVDDLLDVTRIGEKKIQLKKEPVDLCALVQRVLGDYQPAFAEKAVQLAGELPRQAVSLTADPVRLTQAIGNLLHNALKYTAAGGQVHVSVTSDERERMVAIQVRDTGIGIEPDLVETLFQPFRQADSSVSRSHGGLGLGLAIVKGMVELHGGRVTGASDGSNKGARFTIELPLA